jgi:phage terminase large subunit-like protein
MKSMSITRIEELDSHTKKIQKNGVQIIKETVKDDDFRQVTVSSIVKTMLEIIMIKKNHSMDKETRKQFLAITKEIISLAEQTQ